MALLIITMPFFAGCSHEEDKPIDKFLSNPSFNKKAIEYLCQNRRYHHGETWGITGSGQQQEFNLLKYPDRESIKRVLDSLHLKFNLVKREWDSANISTNFIAQQVNQAIQTQKEVPWGKCITAKQFQEYILPYRIENEQVYDWRLYFKQKYQWVIDSLKNETDPVNIYPVIEKEVLKWYRYDYRSSYLSPDQSLDEMLNYKIGECEDFIALYCYILRSLGIACTKDMITWGNRNFGHTEIAVIGSDGKFKVLKQQYFAAGKKPAKVYRRTFSPQPNTLPGIEKNKQNAPSNLYDRFVIDVTNEYAPAFDVQLTIPQNVKDNVLYACSFNNGRWVAVDWAVLNKNKVIFKNLVPNVVYLPAIYRQNQFYEIQPPFWINNQGQEISLEINKNDHVNAFINIDIDDIYIPGKLKRDTNYLVFYWDKKWINHSSIIAGSRGIQITNLPSNTLYLVINKSMPQTPRIFEIAKNQIVWR